MQDTTTYNLDLSSSKELSHPILFISDSNAVVDNIAGFKDYVVETLNSNTEPLIERESMFSYKAYVSRDMRTIIRPSAFAEGWIYGVIFFIAFLYALSIKIFSRKINRIIRGRYNHLTLFIVLSLISMPAFAMLFYAPVHQYNYYSYFPIKSHFGIFLLFYFGIIIYSIAKYILVFFFGELFRTKSICFKYNSNQLGFYFINGLIMIPLLFLYYYLPYNSTENLLVGILIVFLILLLIRMIKGFLLVIDKTKFSKFYLFVYLCILEFIPIIIIYKFLIEY